MEKIKVYIEIIKGNINCICKASNKGCACSCTKDIMYYDKHVNIKECFENKGNKNYDQVR